LVVSLILNPAPENDLNPTKRLKYSKPEWIYQLYGVMKRYHKC